MIKTLYTSPRLEYYEEGVLRKAVELVDDSDLFFISSYFSKRNLIEGKVPPISRCFETSDLNSNFYLFVSSKLDYPITSLSMDNKGELYLVLDRFVVSYGQDKVIDRLHRYDFSTGFLTFEKNIYHQRFHDFVQQHKLSITDVPNRYRCSRLYSDLSTPFDLYLKKLDMCFPNNKVTDLSKFSAFINTTTRVKGSLPINHLFFENLRSFI